MRSIGFDAVSTAAEETKNPNRNIPIGLVGSLGVCTVFYLLVSYCAIGAMGAQPGGTLSQSKEPLAFVLRHLGYSGMGDWVAWSAILALPSVVLMMIYGQTRILFTMSRDGLIAPAMSKVHPKFHTPHVVTIVTGVAVALFAAVFPVDMLADVSNSGTLFAFFAVALGVLILRRTEPNRGRPFRTPLVWLVGPGAMIGCILLFVSLGFYTITLFLAWAAIGVRVYAYYGRRNSHIARAAAPNIATAMMPIHYFGLVIEIIIGGAAFVLLMRSSLSELMKVLIMVAVAVLAILISFYVPIGQKQGANKLQGQAV